MIRGTRRRIVSIAKIAVAYQRFGLLRLEGSRWRPSWFGCRPANDASALQGATFGKSMPAIPKAPSAEELAATLGPAEGAWRGVVAAIGKRFSPLEVQWRPSKSDFGRICLLQHKKRTLVYLMPQKKEITVAVILGEGAYNIAMTAAIPEQIKQMFREARPYAEGRGIRFPLRSKRDVGLIVQLVEIKTATR
jgi:hypothetical protein